MAFFGKVNFGVGQVPNSVSVGNTSTEIVAANTSRKWCVITNIGNRDIFVAIGQTALINKGIFLGRNGGSLLMDAGIMSIESVNGITTSGTSDVIFQEGN